MHFYKVFAATVLLFTGLAVAQDREQYCDPGPFAPRRRIGAWTGSSFCETKWNSGVLVNGIEVWANNKGILAVRTFYSDDTHSPLFGKQGGDKHAKLSWDYTKDKISQVTTWGDGRGRQLGRILIRTKSGMELDIGKNTDGQDHFDSQVGAGILMGVQGRSGDVIDQFGFLFMRGEIRDIEISDIEFERDVDELNRQKQGIVPLRVGNASYVGDRETVPVFEADLVEFDSKTWEQSSLHTVGASVTVGFSGKVLGIGASADTSLSYQYQTGASESQTESKQHSLKWSVTIPNLKAGEKIYCRAISHRGKFSGRYTSKVTMRLEDGYKYSYKEAGKMEQTHWSDVAAECKGTQFSDNIEYHEASKKPTKRQIAFAA